MWLLAAVMASLTSLTLPAYAVECQPVSAAEPAPSSSTEVDAPLTEADLAEVDEVMPPPDGPGLESDLPMGEDDSAGTDSMEAADCTCDNRNSCNCNACGVMSVDYDFNGPIAMAGQQPPSILFYQPMPDVASTLRSGGETVAVNLDWMNTIVREVDSGVLQAYDFEELRATFDYRRGLGEGELAVRLPVDYRGHGMLDRTIEGWHRFFGMSNGLRDTFPEQQFQYTIITRDGVAYNGQSDVAGIGDLAIGYKQPFYSKRNGKAAAWRMGLKAPTGSSSDALGSGNWDVSAGVLWQAPVSRRLRAYANVDYVLTGECDWPNISQKNVLHTMWAAEYAWRPRLSIVCQYTTADNPLRIGSFEADKNPRELTVGFHHRVSDGCVWSGGFREDISSESAPDLTLMSHLKWDL